ncbi:MAG: ribosome-binding factor A [Candidatus Pacebacteria bacterium]|nr:ribosome-binding factor A [Candidatus Paceibacterota bacterium]
MKEEIRSGRLTEYVKEEVSNYIARESNHSSLITVTRVILDTPLKTGTILVTVYPEEKEEEVINFLKRNRSDIRDYLRKHIKARIIPFIDFEIDGGEKNRIRLDELSQ